MKKKQELDFDWDLEEGLRNVSDQSLELAYEFLSRAEFSLSEKDEKIIITNNIVNLCNNTLTTDVLLKDIKEKRDLIYVGRNLEPDGRFPIISALSCYDFKNLFGDVSKLDNIDVPFSKWIVLRRFPNREIELCNSYSCGLNGCLFAICGIIYYLITNKEEYRLAKERDYYHLHKEEIEVLQ